MSKIKTASTAKSNEYSVVIDGKTIKCSTKKTCIMTCNDNTPACKECLKKSNKIYTVCSQLTIDLKAKEQAELLALQKKEKLEQEQKEQDKRDKFEFDKIQAKKIESAKSLVNSFRIAKELTETEKKEQETQKLINNALYMQLHEITDLESEKQSELDLIDSNVNEIQTMLNSAKILNNADMESMISETLSGTIKVQTEMFLALEVIKKSKHEKINQLIIDIPINVVDLQNQILSLEKMIADLLSSKVSKKNKKIKSGSTSTPKKGIVHKKYLFTIPYLTNGKDADFIIPLFVAEFNCTIASALKFVRECNGSYKHKQELGKEGTVQTKMFQYLNGWTTVPPEGDKGTRDLCSKFHTAWKELVSLGTIAELENVNVDGQI